VGGSDDPSGNDEADMTRIVLVLLALTAIAAVAQTNGKSPTKKPAPVSFNIRTASDLAVACSAKPNSPANIGLLNFCNGFGQGVVQAAQNSGGPPKICFPNPAPKRSETMKEFVKWVQADAARKSEVASVGFTSFLSERFPCKS
jgi:hypothetical protein